MSADLYRLCRLLCLAVVLVMGSHDPLAAQRTRKTERDTLKPEQRSQEFYDTVYRKFQRHKITRLIYPIAFRAPSQNSNDPLRTERSEIPYLPYAGKVIRNITIKTLAPFGTSLSDTGWSANLGAIRALNSAHITTQNYVVRRELRFRRGDRVDPHVFSENERNIRGLSFIDNVRFIIREISPGNDTVDVQVITKDVWSIGFQFNTLTLSKVSMTLYDANFLGLGDKVSLRFSMETERAPFFRIDGFSYTYHNISGSFINGSVGYFQDDDGNSNFNINFSRNFFSNTTRWAGMLSFSQSNNADEQPDSTWIHSTYQEELAWLGISYPVRGTGRQTRLILAESVYNKYFLNRPYVTAATDRFYFNATNILTGLSLSWNQYYTTSYLKEFGKPENIPYGRLIQLTIGPSLTEFDTRMYTGLTLGAGNLIGKAGYFSAGIGIGASINGTHYEDGVLKATAIYISNLYTTKGNRYKLRGYLTSGYALGFNRTANNQDYADLNSYLNISGLSVDTALQGTQCLGVRTGVSVFTPWKWYGFRFAFNAAGIFGITTQTVNLFRSGTFYGGLSAGIMIKNDNLVFPPFYILFTVFPGNQPYVPEFRFDMTSIPTYQIPDFVPDYPSVLTLDN